MQVQTRAGQYQAPALKSGPTNIGRGASAIGSFDYGKVSNKGLEGYGAGRVRNIPGGYQRRNPTSAGNYSWGHGSLL